MNNQILKNKKNTKVISVFIIILSFLFLVIITKNIYFDLQVSQDQLANIDSDISKKNDELSKLNNIKQTLNTSSDLSNMLTRYTRDFSEQSILDYFYAYSYRPNSGIIINNISMDKWYKNEYGFIEWNINLAITFRDESSMQAFIDFLNLANWKYNFIITNFSYPLGMVTKDFQVSIPLKVFYY